MSTPPPPASKRQRLENKTPKQLTKKSQPLEPVPLSVHVLRIQSLLCLVLEFTSHWVDHLCSGRVRVNALFHSTCMLPQLMRVVDLRNVTTTIPKRIFPYLTRAQTIMCELHISDCNIAGLMQYIRKVSFSALKRITLANCHVGRKPARKKTTTSTNHVLEWLRHQRPQLQRVDLTGTQILGPSFSNIWDTRYIAPSGFCSIQCMNEDQSRSVFRLKPCDGGCRRPCLSVDDRKLLTKYKHMCSINPTYPCICKLPPIFERCVNCTYVICESCAKTRPRMQDMFRLCHFKCSDPSEGGYLCSACFRNEYQRHEDLAYMDFDIVKCDSCDEAVCENCYSGCEDCNLLFCLTCKDSSDPKCRYSTCVSQFE
jgi:hypothetical protein